ncbi:3-deoxy-7-phosphoheptulonate synthase [Dongshaea marina]|uniref:3-deoxy-7-phosphoheptulonate synthase n=1 Tax=Dongshaea marina TaxID=2047966 RepID=UPI001F40628A|nr:3-deoxy-7-phosphoheptulonate synthase [Dongshaea marina]
MQPTELPTEALQPQAEPKIAAQPAAESKPAQAPAKTSANKSTKKPPLVSREHKAQDTRIQIGQLEIGGDQFITMAGPCSVESCEQIHETALIVKEFGGHMLRGGCFKPRTNPYSFQGLGYQGLDYMQQAGQSARLPIITEVMDREDVHKVALQADVLQIGARNMQNFALLKEVGKTTRPILLKRGLMSSLDELLGAAEYILAHGNQQVMLCERGIRTFETATRNTLDLSAVPLLKQMTHLPIIIDPSHAVGKRDLVLPMAKAAKAVGAHGIIVEVHPDPDKALSDAEQQLNFEQYQQMMGELYR